eukprot:3282375-Rhodomonas_salina.1
MALSRKSRVQVPCSHYADRQPIDFLQKSFNAVVQDLLSMRVVGSVLAETTSACPRTEARSSLFFDPQIVSV